MSGPSTSWPKVTYKRTTSEDHGDIDAVGEQGSGGVLRGFRLACVFDIPQTDGDAVQPPGPPGPARR